jgi:hypothetical protein
MHLKLLNEKGEFLSAEDGRRNYYHLVEENHFMRLNMLILDNIGHVVSEKDYLQRHIDLILENKYIDVNINQ